MVCDDIGFFKLTFFISHTNVHTGNGLINTNYCSSWHIFIEFEINQYSSWGEIL